jgi:hypothetical protein
MEVYWLEHVVGFDLNRQLSIASAAQRWMASYQSGMLMRWLDWTQGVAQRLEGWHRDRELGSELADDRPGNVQWRDVAFHPATLGALIVAILAVAAVFWRGHWQSWRRAIRRDAEESAIRFYQEMLRLLERAGYKRESHQTPQEFASQLAIPAVHQITTLYQRTRFGDQQLTEAEAAQVGSLLNDLKRLRRKGVLLQIAGRRPAAAGPDKIR